LHKNGEWKLENSGKDIDLANIMIDNKFIIDKESISTVIQPVKCIQMCESV
jgi:hypothetical protein